MDWHFKGYCVFDALFPEIAPGTTCYKTISPKYSATSVGQKAS